MANSVIKVLCRFEELHRFLEFLQLAFGLFELFFFLLNVFAEAVELTGEDFKRCFLFPRLSTGAASRCRWFWRFGCGP